MKLQFTIPPGIRVPRFMRKMAFPCANKPVQLARVYGGNMIIRTEEAEKEMKIRTMDLSPSASSSPLLVRVRNQATYLWRDSLLRNSVCIMGITLVTSGLGYLYWIAAAHLYSAEAIGLAAAVISAMSLTASVASVGIGHALVQVLPQRRSGHEWSLTLNAGLVACILVSLLAGIGAAAIMRFLLHITFGGQDSIFLLVFVLSVPIWSLSTLVDQTFIAERVAGKALVRNSTFAALKIPLLVLPFLLAKANALAIFGTWTLSTTASLILGIFLVPRIGRNYLLELRDIARHAWAMLSAFVGQHLIGLGGIAPLYLLPVLVTVRLSAVDNAYFYPTLMTGGLFFMISTAVSMSLFAEGATAPNSMASKIRSSTLIIASLMSVAMLAVFIGRHFILSLFGASYAQHGELLLTILIVSAIPDAITNIYVAWLRVRRPLRYAAMLSLGMAFLTLALAWILLPVQGIAGAAWGWLLAEIAGSVLVGVHLIILRMGNRARANKVQLQ